MNPGSRGSKERNACESRFRASLHFPILLAVVLWCLPTTAFGQIQPGDPQPDSRGTATDHKGQYEIRRHSSRFGLAAQAGAYQPLTNGQRVTWWVRTTVGPKTLAVGVFTSAIQTGRDVPEAYGPGWKGFGKRYGMRTAEAAVDNGFEDILGAASGEDPRYFRMPNETFGRRVRSVIKQGFVTRREDGTFGLAYARFVAIPSGNFLTNTWRAHNENTAGAAVLRTTYSFAWRLADNAFYEFWPDARQRVPFLRNH